MKTMKTEPADTNKPQPTDKTALKNVKTDQSPSKSPNRKSHQQSTSTQSPFNRSLKVRKGAGITGSGVSNISPHLSGRLTLKMLQKEKDKREIEN